MAAEYRTITAQESGDRVDALLSRMLEGVTRSAVQRLIETGAVTVNGVPVKKNRRAVVGEVFTVALPEPEATLPQAQEIPLNVVYEDDDLIVIDKPRGLVVHPAPGHPDGTLVNALLWHCGDTLSGVGGQKRPGIVHRLDMDTSGLIVAAKNDFAHLALSAQLADRSLSRIYEAIVRGRVRSDEGVIDAPIGRHPVDRLRMAVTDKNSRAAVTHYAVLARYRGFTHVRCQLETGRTHQIRVHMAYIGHPVLGDPLYGTKQDRGGAQCLHARELKFIHPRTGLPIRLTSPLPDYFTAALQRLGPPEA